MSRFSTITLSTSALLGLLLISPIRSENEEIYNPQKITGIEILKGLAPIVKDIAAEIPYVKYGVQIWNSAETIYHIIDRTPDPVEVESKKLDILSQQAVRLESSMIDSQSLVIGKIESSRAYVSFQSARNEYSNAVWEVLETYNQFLRHIADGSIQQNSTRDGLVNSLLNTFPNLDSRLAKAYDRFYEKDDNLISTLMDTNDDDRLLFMCKTRKSVQQMVYQFYQKLVEAEVKVYVLKLYLISIRDAAYPGIYNTTVNAAKTAFHVNIRDLTKKIEEHLRILPREVRKCNPKPNRKGTTYVKFGPIFQKYIMSQADSVDPKKIRVPKKHVHNYLMMHNMCGVKRTQNATDYSKDEYACKSNVRNCKLAYDTAGYEFCPRNRTKDGQERYERYDYVAPWSSRIVNTFDRKMKVKAFDNKTECVKSDFTPWGTIRSEAKDLHGICSDLLCTCNDLNEKHLRFFDLRWVKADDDKVITGIRITPVNNTFHLQIKQGNLLPYGFVKGTRTWTLIDPLPPLFDTNKKLENKDYMKLTYDTKTFWLGNINAPKSEVITGIRFAPIPDHSGIRLEILSKEFNFLTGNLAKVDNGFHNRTIPRETIDLNGLDMPDHPKYEDRNENDMEGGNSVLNLTQTDIDLDFGQNILPFVDIQPVETYPPVPLSGVGLFRRSSKGSGGYLALRLLTFDFATTLKHSE